MNGDHSHEGVCVCVCVCLSNVCFVLCCAEQVYADHPPHDDANTECGYLNCVQPEHSEWLQEYAHYLTGLNLTFLPNVGADSELVTDSGIGADGWPASIQRRLNSESLGVLRSTTGVCVATVIDQKVRSDCWGCAYGCPSQRRHTCLYGASQYHYETH